MREVVILFLHLIVTVARLARPGGLRSVVAESILVKHQLLILNRDRKRAPNLRATDRYPCRFVYSFHSPGTLSSLGHRSEAFHSAASPRLATEAEVPDVVLAQERASAWAERTKQRHHRRSRGNETAQSDLGLSPHCPADRASIRNPDGQRCSSPDPERSLPTGSDLGGPFLVDISLSRQR